MTIFIVTEKTTGAEVYRYRHDEVIEWPAMPFTTHDRTALVDTPPAAPAGSRRLTKLEFTDRLGDAAHAAILAMARVSPEIEVFVHRFNVATPEADGTSIDLDDPRLQDLHQIGAVLHAQGVVSENWASEVLDG